MLRVMTKMLEAIARHQGGYFTRAQALDAGFSDDVIRDLVRRGEWCRLRRGSYAFAEQHDALDESERHSVMVRAVIPVLRRPVAVSHVSASVMYGFATWGVDLSLVHVTRAGDGTGRQEGGVHHHLGAFSEDEIRWQDGVPLVDPARAVVESACMSSFASGVALADSALHARTARPDELTERLERMRSWPGAKQAGAVVGFADGRSESVGESLQRVLCLEQGLPIPDLQRELFGPGGEFVARVDMLFEEQRTVVEFDGRIKYRSDAPDVIYREKRREDRIRALGYRVVRVCWSDLFYPAYTANRIRAAFASAVAA